jgi:hypothetical protein
MIHVALAGHHVLMYRNAGEVYQLGNTFLGLLARRLHDCHWSADPAFLGELDVERHGVGVERGWWKVLCQQSELEGDDGRRTGGLSQTLMCDCD